MIKKLIILFFAAGLTVVATAQPKIGSAFKGGFRVGVGAPIVHGPVVRPRVTVIAPVNPWFGFGYGVGYYSPYRYSPFYNPYDPFYRNRPRQVQPTELDLKIEEIENDYDYQIDVVKHDKTIPKDDRKARERELKHQKEQAIIDAKKNYYAPAQNNNDEVQPGVDNNQS